MGKISKQSLTGNQTKELTRLMEAAADLENIGDLIETNLVVLGNERIDQGVSISDPTQEVLNGFQKTIMKSVDAAVQAVSQRNELAAQAVISMKDEITRTAESAASHQAQRLVAEEPNRIPAYTIEIDIIEKQKRIYYFAKAHGQNGHAGCRSRKIRGLIRALCPCYPFSLAATGVFGTTARRASVGDGCRAKGPANCGT